MSLSEPVDLPIKRGVFVGDDFSPDRAQLRGTQCTRCGETFFPTRSICPRCQTDAVKDVTLGRSGKVSSITAVLRHPKHYEKPYWLAEVDLPEGVRLTAQIDSGMNREVRVGDAVTLTTRPILSLSDGKRIWGYVFAPSGAREKAP